MQVFGAAQNYIDFVILHSYPIYDQTYYTWSSSNPNYQASPSLEPVSVPIVKRCLCRGACLRKTLGLTAHVGLQGPCTPAMT